MPNITITGLPPIDGEYQLDLVFTHRDFRTIKQLTGVRAAEVMEAIEAGDTDIFVAMAAIALRRAGVDFNPENLWDIPMGGLTLDFAEGEAEEVVEDSPPSGAVETRIGGAEDDSGISTNGATDASPEITTPDFSGTPQPESSSDPVTSTT